jgi:hypothetical protein
MKMMAVTDARAEELPEAGSIPLDAIPVEHQRIGGGDLVGS